MVRAGEEFAGSVSSSNRAAAPERLTKDCQDSCLSAPPPKLIAAVKPSFSDAAPERPHKGLKPDRLGSSVGLLL